MKFGKPHENFPQIMIVPMIDIMFFLLVFFMMATTDMVNMNLVPLKLAAMQEGKMADAKGMVISIDATGSFFVDAEKIQQEHITECVQAALNVTPEALIILRVDKEAPYNAVLMIVEELKKLGVRKVALASEKRH